MIIRRLCSENLFKYKKLDLNGLPARGRILIAGSNESGKSAILETIALALFGRTSNLTHASVGKAVRWGTDNASVTLEFQGSDLGEYSLFRYFDADGVQRARLTRQDQEQPLAQGVEAVNEAMIQVIGFDYTQYTDALYLTLGRHSHPRPQDTVKELAGVATLENLSGEMANEIHAEEEAIDARQQLLTETHEKIHALALREEALGELEAQMRHASDQVETATSTAQRWEGFDAALMQSARNIATACQRLANTTPETGLPGWWSRASQMDTALAELESVCLGGQVEMDSSPAAPLREWQQQLQGRLTDLARIQESAQEEQNRLTEWLEGPVERTNPESSKAENARLEQTLRQLERARARQGFGVIVFLLVALAAGAGTWVAMHSQQNPEFAPRVVELLARHIPNWENSRTLVLMPTAILATLLTLWNLVGRWRKQGRIRAALAAGETLKQRVRWARERVAAINNALSQPLEHQTQILATMENAPWLADLQAWIRAEGQPLLTADALRQYLAGLDKRVKGFQTEIGHCREEAQEQLAATRAEIAAHEQMVLDLEQAVRDEKERRREHARLGEAVKTMEAENHAAEHAIAVRRIARELLKGTCIGLSAHFNQELHRFIASTAPLFTQGRYRHLRLDDDLDVSVFSEAKNDFVRMEEVSTGVRRQLNLAIRMALAQALALRCGGLHAIALDEPFAYYDRQRFRESLDALLRISDKITQIWVVGQEFDTEASATGLYIQCILDQDTLVMNRR
ncbi:MAG: AAA family ATPase [Magnetococcales bacterium]|nr:AAA family ATPase [Magnetococcales bacterium]